MIWHIHTIKDVCNSETDHQKWAMLFKATVSPIYNCLKVVLLDKSWLRPHAPANKTILTCPFYFLKSHVASFNLFGAAI
jgi:hypothetical protein